MSSRTVQNVVTYPGTSSPIPGRTISIQLNVPGFSNSGSTEILSTRVIQADDAGLWSVDLTPNAEIDPAGTYYTAREIRGGVIWPFIVTAGSGAVNLRDCLVADPTNSNPLTAGAAIDLSNVDPATGRAALGLGTAATHPSTDFDAAGAASTAQAAAITAAASDATTKVAAEATARAAALTALVNQAGTSMPRAIGSPTGEPIVLKVNTSEPTSGARYVQQGIDGCALNAVSPGGYYSQLPRAQTAGGFDVVLSHDSSLNDTIGTPWNAGGHHVGVALNWASVTDFAFIMMFSANDSTAQASVKIAGVETALLDAAMSASISFGQKIRMQCSIDSGVTQAVCTWSDYATGTVLYSATITLGQSGRTFKGYPAFHVYSAKGTLYHGAKFFDTNSQPTAVGEVWGGVADNGSSTGAGTLACNGLHTVISDGSLRIMVVSASGGTWTPSVTPNAGSPTSATAVAYNASAATLQTSLRTVIGTATVVLMATGIYIVGGLAGGTVALGTNSLTGTGATVDISGNTPSNNWSMLVSPRKMKNGVIRGFFTPIQGRMLGVMVRQGPSGAGYLLVYDGNTSTLLLKGGQSNAVANIGFSTAVTLTAGTEYPFEVSLRDNVFGMRINGVQGCWTDTNNLYPNSGFVGLVGFNGVFQARDLSLTPALDSTLLDNT